MTVNKKNNSIAIWIFLTLALLGTAGYLFYAKYEKEKVILEQKQLLADQEKLTYELNNKVDAMMDELDESKDENSQLSEMVDAQKLEIAQQKKRISGMIRSQKDLQAAQTEIDELQSLMSGYRRQIEDMKLEIASLTAANTELVDSNVQLTTRVIEIQEENDELLTVKGDLEMQKDLLSKSNEELNSRVNKASAINLDFAEVDGIRIRSNGSPAKTRSSKKATGMQLCIDLSDNALVSEAQETLYLRVSSPGGETITTSDKVMQVYDAADTSTDMLYSASYTVDYSGADTECILWEPGLPLSPGNYDIELYNKGHLMASTSYEFR